MAKTSTQLSERQAQVAALVAAGKSNREIAAMLSVAERTVETHVAAIYTKLDVRSRMELAVKMRRAEDVDERASIPPTNLQRARKRLVGREADCALIRSLLAANAIVTLTGAGGSRSAASCRPGCAAASGSLIWHRCAMRTPSSPRSHSRWASRNRVTRRCSRA